MSNVVVIINKFMGWECDDEEEGKKKFCRSREAGGKKQQEGSKTSLVLSCGLEDDDLKER